MFKFFPIFDQLLVLKYVEKAGYWMKIMAAAITSIPFMVLSLMKLDLHVGSMVVTSLVSTVKQRMTSWMVRKFMYWDGKDNLFLITGNCLLDHISPFSISSAHFSIWNILVFNVQLLLWFKQIQFNYSINVDLRCLCQNGHFVRPQITHWSKIWFCQKFSPIMTYCCNQNFKFLPKIAKIFYHPDISV